MLLHAISEMFMTPKQAANQVVIRKYANRRLYDTNASRYVTIDDLKLMVKNSLDFRVVDAKNGQDLTRFTLVQIILEIESEGHKLLPIGVLQQLIPGDGLRSSLGGEKTRTTLRNRWRSHKSE